MLAVSNIGMAALWLRITPEYGAAGWFAGVHLIASTLPFLLVLAPPPRGPVTRSLWDLYPLAMAAVFWGELDVHARLVTTTPFDALLVRLDRAAFGVHVNQAWMTAMHGAVFSEVMHALYVSYYLLLLGVPTLLLIWGSPRLIREGVLGITLAYLICFTVHAWWPTVGPEVLGVTFPPSVSAGWFFRISHWVLVRGDSWGTAFPSSHVAGAVTFAWIAWRLRRPRVAVCVTGLASGIAGAVIYTQNHFALDAVGGVLVGVVVQGLLVPGLARMETPGSPPATVPAVGYSAPTLAKPRRV